MEREKVTEILVKYEEFKNILSGNYNSVRELKENIWEVILDISQKVSSFVDFSGGSTAEDMGIQKLKNLANGNEGILKIEEMLDLFFQKVQEILEQKKKILPFSFFKSKKYVSNNGENGKVGEEKIYSLLPKYKMVLNLLNDIGIDIDKVQVSEEYLEEENNGEGEKSPQVKKRRKEPYISIQIKDKKKKLNITILVCDELGQSTFIYDGIFKLEELKNIEKEEKINGFNCYTIPYGEKNFYDKLKVQIEFLSFKKFDEAKYKEELKNLGIAEELIQKYSIEIGMFRYFFDKFLGQGEEKTGIAVEKMDGENILFIPFRGFSPHLILGGKRLGSSLSESFNEKYFGRKKHTKRDDLVEMLNFLAYKIATDEQMKQRWKKIIEENKKPFETIGVYNKDGIWYFGNIHGSPENLIIAGYHINYFRPREFKDNKGKMITAVYDSNLKNLFQNLGLSVASEQQEKENFVEVLRNEYTQGEQDFKKRGIVFQEEKWYICGKKPYTHNRKSKEIGTNNKSSDDRWGELVVNGKSFKYFPSISFNKTYCIKSPNLKTNGIMKSKNDLKIILEVLGETVATEEESKKFFSSNYSQLA